MSASQPKRAFIAGAFWTVGMRWAVKGIGFINTVIMARLLAPADYGLVAMAMLVVGLIGAFLDLGTEVALLRKDEVSKDEIDSAWTLQAIQGVLIGSMVAVLSIPASLYFEEPRVTPMLWVLGACVAVAGLQNVGLVLAQKQLNFRLEFWHSVAAKVLSVLATIIAGFTLGDYRALLIGIATGYLGGTLLSYLLHPYRPRWNTRETRSIWNVSKWLMVSNMGGYLLGKADELAAARVGSTAEFGTYNVGADLGSLPITSIGPAVMQSMLPVLAKLEGQPERTNAAITKIIGALNTITLPLGVAVAALATPIALVVLGAKWPEAATFIAIFALCGAMRFTVNPLAAQMVLRNHTRIGSRMVWFEFAFFIAGALVLAPLYGITGLALARLAAVGCNAVVVAWTARRCCDISLRPIAFALARPFAGAVLMAGVITLAIEPLQVPLLQLLAGSAAGGLCFVVWSFATWHLVGRPEGLESTLVDMGRQRFGRRA